MIDYHSPQNGFSPSRARISRASPDCIVAEDPATACVKSVKSEVQKVHAEMVETIQCSDVITWNEGI